MLNYVFPSLVGVIGTLKNRAIGRLRIPRGRGGELAGLEVNDGYVDVFPDSSGVYSS